MARSFVNAWGALLLTCALLSVVPAFVLSVGAQQSFPASAVIRGENIWLRVDPAEDTEVVAYLQRGDEVLVTDVATVADGGAFYPIEVVATGETGWVRELAIDPRTFAGANAVVEEMATATLVDESPE